MNSKVHLELAAKSAPLTVHRAVATFGREYLKQGEHVLKVLGALGNSLKARREARTSNHPKARETLERAERIVGKWLTDCLESPNGASLLQAVANGLPSVEANGITLLEMPVLVLGSTNGAAIPVSDACKTLEDSGMEVPSFAEAPPRDPVRQRIAMEVVWRSTYQDKVRMSMAELRALFPKVHHVTKGGFTEMPGDGLHLKCPSDETLRRIAKEFGIELIPGKPGAPKGKKQNRVLR